MPASGITVTQVDTKIPKITKMKKIQSVFIILLTVFHLSAQMNQGKYVPFHFSFIPPLSSNGINASQYTNGASFSILAGMSANERNFTFASISNVIANDCLLYTSTNLESLPKGFHLPKPSSHRPAKLISPFGTAPVSKRKHRPVENDDPRYKRSTARRPKTRRP